MARAQKEECFQRSGKDNWYFYLYVDGKRRRVSTRTTVKKEAETIRVAEQDRQRRAAVFGTQEVLTFGEACGYYLKAGKSDRYLAPLFELWESTLVKTLSPGRIKQAAIDLHPDAKPATWIRQVVTPAVAVINHAAELNLCTPVRVKRWKVARTLKKAVDRGYIDALMAAAPVPQIAALVLFMFTTGVRITAATSLEWEEHINLQEAAAVVGRDKNGDPHVVHLTAELVAMLSDLLSRGGRNKGKVFGYSSRYSVYSILRRMAAKAGYEYVPPHQMGRHSFATELLDAGLSVPDVMKLGNWKSSQLVLEIYAHSKKQRRDAIEEVFGDRRAARTEKPSIGTQLTPIPRKALRSKG